MISKVLDNYNTLSRILDSQFKEVNVTNWREGNSRPSKKGLVKDYILKNPEDNPTEIAIKLNISRNTLYKYWGREKK